MLKMFRILDLVNIYYPILMVGKKSVKSVLFYEADYRYKWGGGDGMGI